MIVKIRSASELAAERDIIDPRRAANLPFFTEDDAFTLPKYYQEFLTFTDRLRELGHEWPQPQVVTMESGEILVDERSVKRLRTTGVIPCPQVLDGEELPPEDMSNTKKDDDFGGQNTDPPSLSSVADPTPGQIRPGPAVAGLAKALEGLRAMQERNHRQRVLDTTRAQAEAAALEQEHLRKEAEAQAAARYREYLSRDCPSSQEYQDRVERSRQHRVAAKNAEAAAWRHAFQVTCLQGVGVSGAPGSFLRLQRRFERRRAERRVAWSAEEAERKHAWNAARSQGVGTSTTPSAVLRKKKYRLFSPASDHNDRYETGGANDFEKGERYTDIDLLLSS
ncbi:hypothetical protein C8F04DRAFT_1267981 [Mycena alexandri]|uniref:Uncharacterized protein n=1 Tax=Mycena alexandri TaxID=1745969 RepID=A0AAD6SIA3_9AGAR|nr:hypothetical protein C8F04DRAFT_1267981 [Mycena alexandri]